MAPTTPVKEPSVAAEAPPPQVLRFVPATDHDAASSTANEDAPQAHPDRQQKVEEPQHEQHQQQQQQQQLESTEDSQPPSAAASPSSGDGSAAPLPAEGKEEGRIDVADAGGNDSAELPPVADTAGEDDDDRGDAAPLISPWADDAVAPTTPVKGPIVAAEAPPPQVLRFVPATDHDAASSTANEDAPQAYPDRQQQSYMDDGAHPLTQPMLLDPQSASATDSDRKDSSTRPGPAQGPLEGFLPTASAPSPHSSQSPSATARPHHSGHHHQHKDDDVSIDNNNNNTNTNNSYDQRNTRSSANGYGGEAEGDFGEYAGAALRPMAAAPQADDASPPLLREEAVGLFSPVSPPLEVVSSTSSSPANRRGVVVEEEEEGEEVVVAAPSPLPSVSPLTSPSPASGDADAAESVEVAVDADDGTVGGGLVVAGAVSARMTEDELQAARLKAYEETCPVSTLDFLRETGDTVLPDAIQGMFAATSNFFQSSRDAVAQTMPAPLKHAARKTGHGLALLAEFTGDILTNAPEYVMAALPNSLVSQETKQLVAVDFLAVLRVTLDVNVLAAPYVFRMAGLVGGLFVLIGAFLLCYYNAVAFFAAKNQLRDAGRVVMYGDVPRMTWGKWFPMISLWYSAAFLIAHTTYAASNLEVLLHTMGITGGTSTALAFIMPSVFSLPFVFMKRASSQPPLAVVASLLVFVSCVLFLTALPFSTPAEVMAMELRLWAADAPEFFIAIGIAVYMACPLRTAVPVERNMDPKRFPRLLAVAMGIAFVSHVVYGVCVFVALRGDTCSVLAVSLPAGAVPTAAAAILFFAFLLVIPLTLFRAGELCDRRVLGVRALPTYWQVGPNLLRIVALAGAALIAFFIPYYGLLLGLGGAFGCGIVGIVVPAALDYVRRQRVGLREGRHLRWWEYGVVFSNAAFGAVCVVLLGIVFSFYHMWLVTNAGYKVAC